MHSGQNTSDLLKILSASPFVGLYIQKKKKQEMERLLKDSNAEKSKRVIETMLKMKKIDIKTLEDASKSN